MFIYEGDPCWHNTNYLRGSKMDLLRIIFAILLPPLGVFLQVGFGSQFWLKTAMPKSISNCCDRSRGWVASATLSACCAIFFSPINIQWPLPRDAFGQCGTSYRNHEWVQSRDSGKWSGSVIYPIIRIQYFVQLPKLMANRQAEQKVFLPEGDISY